MKYFNVFFAFFLLFSIFNLNAQDEPCGVPELDPNMRYSQPWYNDDSYFARMMDSVNAMIATNGVIERNGCTDRFVIIPVKIWIHRETATEAENLPNLRDFQDVIDGINDTYQRNELPFRFVLKCPEDVVNANLVDINFTQATWSSAFGSMPTDLNAVNIHIIRTLNSGARATEGVWAPNLNGFAVRRRAFNASIVAHELGHYFGLLWHTHAFSGDITFCLREPVGRNARFGLPCPTSLFIPLCKQTGDFLCSTDADPNLSRRRVTNCQFDSPGVLDRFNRPFELNIPLNIMSYGPVECASLFSSEQRGIIAGVASTKPFIRSSTLLTQPDRYEPNDQPREQINTFAGDNRRVLRLGQTQCHTFHGSIGCNDTEDWIPFFGGSVGPWRITIRSAGPGLTHPVTNVEVFRVTEGTPDALVSVRNLNSNNNVEFNVDVADCTGRFYWIRVRGTTGRYNITAAGQNNNIELTGGNTACVGKTFSVVGAPAGATFQWTISNRLTTTTGVGPSTQITGVFFDTDPLTIAVEITNGGCRQRLERVLTDGSAGILPFTLDEATRPCFPDYPKGVYRISNPTPGVTYNWSCSGGCSGLQVSSDKREASFSLQLGVPWVLSVNAVDGCGNTSFASRSGTYVNCNSRLQDSEPCAPADGALTVTHPTPVENTQFGRFGYKVEGDYTLPVGLFTAGTQGRYLDYEVGRREDGAQAIASNPPTQTYQNYDTKRIQTVEGMTVKTISQTGNEPVQQSTNAFSFSSIYANGNLNLYPTLQEGLLSGTFRCGAYQGGTLLYAGQEIASTSSWSEVVGFAFNPADYISPMVIVRGFDTSVPLFFHRNNSGQMCVAGLATPNLKINDESYGDSRYFVAIVDDNGVAMRPYFFNNDRLQKVTWDDAGNRLVWLFQSYGGNQVKVVYTSQNNTDEHWSKTISANVAVGELDMAYDPVKKQVYVGLTNSGNVSADGRNAAGKGQKDVTLLKYNTNGSLADLRQYGSTQNETVMQLHFDKDALFFGGELRGNVASRIIGRNNFVNPAPTTGFNRAYISMLLASDFRSNPDEYKGPIQLQVTTTRPTNNNANGSITVNASGGNAPYGFLWAGGATSAIRTGLTAGTYTVTVLDQNGCSARMEIVLVAVSTPLSPAIQSRLSINDRDANTPPGVAAVTTPPRLLTFTYEVINTGNTDLINVNVNSTWNIAYLPIGASQSFVSTTYATELGQRVIYGTVSGQVLGTNITVSNTDLAYYFGIGINMDKEANKTTVCPGEPVVFTLKTRMKGGAPGLQLRNIQAKDNHLPGEVLTKNSPHFIGGDLNGNGYLDFIDADGDGRSDEEFTWQYTLYPTQNMVNKAEDEAEAWYQDPATGQATFIGKVANSDEVTITTSSLLCNPVSKSAVKRPIVQRYLQVFPNPASRSFTIQVPASADQTMWQVQVFDVLGRQIWADKITNSTTVEVKDWSPGLYRVKATTLDGAATHVLTNNIMVQQE
jgi:Secretion system C-terminal sorting domain/SprB repeat